MKAIIEIPKGSTYKYEVNKTSGVLTLDRVINQEIPFNYGFLIGTKSKDGDALDIFILGNESIPPLTEVTVEFLAVLKCKDGGLEDDKVIARIAGDNTVNKEKFFHELTQIIDYLSSYKEGFEILDYQETINFGDYKV